MNSKPKAWVALKPTPNYALQSFLKGFERLGYQACHGYTHTPGPNDVLLIWNRWRGEEIAAEAFETAGRPVLIAENGYLGKQFNGHRWYAISRNYHNGAGTWVNLGPERWGKYGCDLDPFRESGDEIVLLPQRFIGCPGVAMPRGWQESALSRVKARVRPHPGINPCLPLKEDLVNAEAVYTWGSGAAIKALMYGIPVWYDMPNWIGAPAASRFGEPLNRNEEDRLKMFQRLIWAMWTLDEVEEGTPFKVLL